ncbi:hypothetical protein [Streptomyces sp. NRRL WC-3742]|uniref:hypothetical protein n=1 Tax=Streptomyces sp. NRRL WC-3742 TaxID=1463934 RepID=UPI0004CC894F|nr:hypothetical protein [Streptomyces sp. NRRL WC-3742]
MAARKLSKASWQDVPGAQEVMDRALPLARSVQAREYGPLATVVFETALLFTNADGLPDLRRESYAARMWMSDLLDGMGLKPVPGDSAEHRKKLKEDRDTASRAVRAAMSQVRVDYIRSLDDDPVQREERFPGLASADEIFAYYRIVPQAQKEIVSANRRALQVASRIAFAEGDDLAIPPARSPQVVRSFRLALDTLTPQTLASLDTETRDQLREELQNTRAALLALENELS